ncbi:hypothetical protein CP973_17340 [Streptomyces albofaciens JCM 4342]|uniref:hypothetical protein n=1 Tax=Streptomyces albofaciens TaxID=66866 RepID=UPI001239FFE4|nr:hypothetical protein [Streptomyces albofaciens]KAA6223455.1 hypothetical protein CP973_17340 [Streptomyces albofaciens JCM 4342]
MRVERSLLTVAVVGAGVAAALRRFRPRAAGDHASAATRWLTVTINRTPTDVMPHGTLPEPLDRLADRLEAQVRPAPGDRGTELAVRLKEAPSAAAASLPGRLAGQDPRQEVRTALREAKALLETGEVMRPDAPPTTRDTPAGRLVGLVTRRSGGEGVL